MADHAIAALAMVKQKDNYAIHTTHTASPSAPRIGGTAAGFFREPHAE